ncbi:hypothetical protein V9N52_002318 [Vibrio navarrensis]
MRIGILFLVSLTALFTSFSYANTCPIGKRYDRVEFPLGTPIVYSVCIDGCRGEQKFNDLDTWTCTDNLGKCVALYTLTGQSCTGKDDTDGSCDSNGQNCTTEPDTGNPDPNPDPDEPQAINIPAYKGTDADQAAVYVASNFSKINKLNSNVISVNQNLNNFKRLVESASADVQLAASSINTNNYEVLAGINQIKGTQQSHFNNLVGRIGEVRNNTNDIKAQLSSIDKKVDALATEAETPQELKDIAKAVSNTLIPNSYILNNNVSTTNSRLDSVKRTLEDNHNSSINYFARRMDELIAAVKSGGGDGDGSGGDNSEVVGAIDSVGTKIDGLGDSLEGMGDKLGGLSDKLDGKGLTKGNHDSLINFGETPLYQESEVEKLAQEVADLKEQYTEKVNDFKGLFSLNLDSLSNGEYKEHFLEFEFANGARLRAGSSVFPALIDNAGLIAAVILFIAVMAGLRVVMGAKD